MASTFWRHASYDWLLLVFDLNVKSNHRTSPFSIFILIIERVCTTTPSPWCDQWIKFGIRGRPPHQHFWKELRHMGISSSISQKQSFTTGRKSQASLEGKHRQVFGTKEGKWPELEMEKPFRKFEAGLERAGCCLITQWSKTSQRFRRGSYKRVNQKFS